MSKQVQLRRGTTSEHAVFTGAVGELTIDIDKDVAVVHDGVKVGGHELAKADLSNHSGVGVLTATQFVTGASGSAIGINTNTISGPATLIIDPAGVGDNTGLVVIKGDLQIDGDGATILSVGTTAQRPSTPVVGMFRFNTDISNFEGYNGNSWVEVGAASESASLEGDLDTQSGTEDLMEGSGTIDLNE